MAAAVVLATTTTLMAATPAHATPSASRCGFTTMIAVRGTDEPAGTGSANSGRTYASGGYGPTLDSLVVSMRADPNLPFYVEGLAYPAVALDVLNFSSPTYLNSVTQGATNLRNEIENLASSCPSTNIVLAGYSQGAAVINNVLSGNGGGLSTSGRNHVAAVVMFGSPNYYGGEAWNAPGSPSGQGIFGGLGSPRLADFQRVTWLPPAYSTQGYKTIIRSYCYTGDAFCQNNPTTDGIAVHRRYATNQATMINAYGFIYDWLTSNN